MHVRRTLGVLVALTGLTVATGTVASLGAEAQAAVGSQPGISGKTITVGTISDISGPIAGAFAGASYGAEAYAAYVDSKGGVDGYQLKVKAYDSQTSCQGATTAVQEASSSAFALVGGISLSDQCEVATLKAHPDLAFIQSALSPAVEALPNYYSIDPSKPGTAQGPYRYMAQADPSAVKKTAVLAGTTAGAQTQQNYFDAAMKKAGYDIVYSAGIDPTVTDFTADIVRLRSLGVQYLFLDMFGQQISDVMNQANQQGWHPKVIQSVDSYEAQWFKSTSGTANTGLIVPLYTAMYLGEDAKAVPEVSTYLSWLKKVQPSFPPDTYSVTAWGDMALFVHELQSLGSTPTQQKLLKALSTTKTFSDNGLFAPAGIGSRTPATCYVIVEATAAGQWKRLTPTSGYRCTPGGYLNYK
jgi:branched-chain amino acid transport system substrate-binding protein